MTIELINRLAEKSAIYEVEQVISETYGGKKYFRLYFGNGKYSKEYSEPNYEYGEVTTNEQS